ncbi:MAG TPA: L,D-transpeptidase family protein [Moraxellaceae bacterium]|nr:L,D-transpeptidase family protein [Moraxellaceae bacterium]
MTDVPTFAAVFLARLLLVALLLAAPVLAAAETVAGLLQARLAPALANPRPLALEPASLPQAVAVFYAGREWMPAWDEARVAALLRALESLAGDGLSPADYGVAPLRALAGAPTPEAQAERELAATRACLLALLHLYRGKVDPRTLDAHWNFPARRLDPAVALQEVETAVREGRIDDLFDRARPVWGYYHRLRIALAQLRRVEAGGGWPVLPAGPTLKPGASDARVPLLRQRLRLAGLLPADSGAATAVTTAGSGGADTYDAGLQAAVQRFQREANLEPDGAIGPATRNELNLPVAVRIAQVRANLERVRWFKSDLDKEAVIVDLAGYRILYLRDGELRWSSRVQVGREYRPSPVFQSTITYLTLSPGWVVPPTILREDALPAIRRNRGYLAKNRLRVFNAAGEAIPARAVNWWRPGNIQLRQDPGPDGALGEVVIRFDNPYSVYLHDTPHKELFSASRRATSSGCIRVENVHELAVLLLDDPVNWSREKLQQAIDVRETRKVPLSRGVPILLGYWTVQVDPDGYVAFRPDIYHRDEPLLQALDAAR